MQLLSMFLVFLLTLTSCSKSPQAKYEDCLKTAQGLYEMGVKAGMDPDKSMQQALFQTHCDQYQR